MHIARKLALGLLGALFIPILFTSAIVFSIIAVAGSPAKVKHILSDTGIYSTVIPDALAQAKVAHGDQAEIPLNQKVVLDAASQAFTPQILQTNAEKAIDGVYSWLDGNGTNGTAPQFQLDLTQAKAGFAAAIAKAAETQTAALPICPAGTTLPDKFDPFSAACRPSNITPAQAAVLAQDAVNNNQDFLKNPVIKANELKNDQGKLLFAEQLSEAPKWYQWVKQLPMSLIILSIVLAGAIILVSEHHLKGLKHIGIILLLSGLLILVFAWGLNYGINKKALPKLSVQNNAVITKDVKTVITEVTQSIDKNYWWFGGIYTALGIGSIAAAQVLIRRGQPAMAHASKGAPESQGANEPEPRPAQKPPVKSKSRNIPVNKP